MAFDQLPIAGPFGGIVDDQPRPTKDPKTWDDLVNFIPYEGRLISRPRLNGYGNPPDGAIVRLMYRFTDLQGFDHNLVLTTQTAYAVTGTTVPTYNVLALPAPLTNLSGTNLPYGIAVMLGRVYFCNGSTTGLYAEGSDHIAGADGSGPLGAWRFAGVLGNHLVVLNTTEPAPGYPGSTRYGNRVKWSASGDPQTWDVGAGSTAGFTDLLEVPDQITGFSTLGRSGYIFRNNGITLMTPTGVGVAPFQFDQITNAPLGVGNWYPYSLSTYGSICCFASSSDVYAFDGSSFNNIGKAARKKIFADIGATPVNSIYGWIIPRLGAGFPLFSYWLSLPNSVQGGPVCWVFNFDSQAWWRFWTPYGQLTALGNLLVG
jgi:hypothetical protein